MTRTAALLASILIAAAAGCTDDRATETPSPAADPKETPPRARSTEEPKPRAEVSLAGRVADADGRVLAGATVHAEPMWRYAGFPETRTPVTTTASADGAYEFADLGAGDWELFVSADGAVRAPAARVRVPDVRRLDLALPIGGTVAGTLVDAETRNPLAGAVVTGVAFSEGDIVSATTSADGKFEMLTHRESVTMEHFRVETPDRPKQPSGFESNVDLDLVEATRLDVALDLGRGALLAGTVTGPSGPVAGATVHVWAHTFLGPSPEARTTTTDASGRYEFRHLDECEAVVRVDVAGLVEPALHTLELGPPESFPWQAPEECHVVLSSDTEARHDVTLVKDEPWPKSRLAGHVLAEDGSPISGAKVVDARVLPEVATTTDAKGEFAIECVADAERAVTACASHPDFESYLKAFDSGAEGVEFRLTPNPRVRGRVTSSDGAPLPGARVRVVVSEIANACRFGGGGPSGPTFHVIELVADERGEYSTRFSRRYGTVEVHAEAPGLVGGVSVVEEKSLGDGPVDVVLPRPLAIAGRVVAEGSQRGLAGVPVSIGTWPVADGDSLYDDANAIYVVRAITGDDGAFRVDGLPPGKWRVAAGGGAWLVATSVVEAGNTSLTVAVEEALVISGTATFADGTAPSGVAIRVWPGSPDEHHVGTDQVGSERFVAKDGRFVIRDLAPGKYTLAFDGGSPEVQDTKLGPFDAGAKGLALRLVRGFTITGRVVGSDGAIVAKARVWAEPPEDSGRPRGFDYSHDDGTFVLSGLDAGLYRVVVRADGFVFASTPDVTGGREPLTMRVDAGLAASGVVLGEDGAPVADATVELDYFAATETVNRPSPQSAKTDASGRFRVTGLSKGKWWLRVNDADFEVLAVTTVEAGAAELVVRAKMP